MKDQWLRAAIDLGAFLVALSIGHMIFDSWAIALLMALIFMGGADVAQRS